MQAHTLARGGGGGGGGGRGCVALFSRTTVLHVNVCEATCRVGLFV